MKKANEPLNCTACTQKAGKRSSHTNGSSGQVNLSVGDVGKKVGDESRQAGCHHHHTTLSLSLSLLYQHSTHLKQMTSQLSRPPRARCESGMGREQCSVGQKTCEYAGFYSRGGRTVTRVRQEIKAARLFLFSPSCRPFSTSAGRMLNKKLTMPFRFHPPPYSCSGAHSRWPEPIVTRGVKKVAK